MSLLGIDIGTTGCKAVAFDENGKILALSYNEYPLLHPKEGYCELEPNLVFNNIKNSLIEINQKVGKDKIQAFAISCQGEAIIPIDRNNNPLYNAIVTFDGRTKEQCLFWEKEFGKKKIFSITGMPLHPMYSINKIMWVKKHLAGIYKKAYKFLCFEDFVFSQLGMKPTIDHCLAARTMALDIKKKEWSKEILETVGIKEDKLAELKPSGQIVGRLNVDIAKKLGFTENVFGVTGGHDQGCGALGAGITKAGVAMNATGTSDVLAVIYNDVNLSDKMLEYNYSCYPYVTEDKYMSISFNLTGGLLLRWFRDNFCEKEIKKAKKDNMDAYDLILHNIQESPTNLFILPHFVGSGTPYMDSNSKGLLIGLDLETGKNKIAKAIIESLTFDLRFNLEKLKQSGIVIKKLVAIGGGAKSIKWLKLKADILDIELITLENLEAASFGAALLAGKAIGIYSSYQEAIKRTVKEKMKFIPDKRNLKIYNKRYKIYKDIYRKNKNLLHRINDLD